MDSPKIPNLGQILSAAALVLSLVFVGYEIRQNTLAVRSQTRQELANGSREVLLAIAQDPALARAWSAIFGAMGQQADPSLTLADTLQAQYTMFANLRNLENVWLQHREGVVDESVLQTYGFRSSVLFRSAAFQTMWPLWRSILDPGFVDAFEEANDLR